MKDMCIWVPTDQETWGASRCIAIGAEPPQPGLVYRVLAKSAQDGAAKVYLATRKEPDEDKDPQGWFSWRLAKKAVTCVGSKGQIADLRRNGEDSND